VLVRPVVQRETSWASSPAHRKLTTMIQTILAWANHTAKKCSLLVGRLAILVLGYLRWLGSLKRIERQKGLDTSKTSQLCMNTIRWWSNWKRNKQLIDWQLHLQLGKEARMQHRWTPTAKWHQWWIESRVFSKGKKNFSIRWIIIHQVKMSSNNTCLSRMHLIHDKLFLRLMKGS